MSLKLHQCCVKDADKQPASAQPRPRKPSPEAIRPWLPFSVLRVAWVAMHVCGTMPVNPNPQPWGG